MSFKEKVIIITGAASGIGKATAKMFHAKGASLVLGDVNRQGLESVVQELTGGAPIFSRSVDVGDPSACHEFVATAVAEYGKLDVLCNVAGILDWSPLSNFDSTRWDRIVAVNLRSVFFLSQAAMPYLIATKGNIVNISSSAALVGIAYNSAYCATKAGVVAMTKSMAIEFAADGVRINAICPSAVNTPLITRAKFPEGADMALIMRNAVKLGRYIEPEEIAAAIAYLASEDGRSISGIAFPVDGAQTAG